ncbi:hypothetical protein [Luteolibacter soli]|uniref:Uncharacterized protein n=1 Tax=Luteolibacter soli TaxID=3135280 RepID=A0ABU9AWA8_9BACT
MKTTSSILALVAVTTLLHAAPPQAQPTPEDLAKGKVAVEIYGKVNSMSGRFSRVGPINSHQLEFQAPMFVKEEKRLPFTITPVRNPKVAVQLQGYIRLSDQEIFLLDQKTGQYLPAREDPRFAPPQQQRELPLPKIEPAKPL